jgi:hypothetical protein
MADELEQQLERIERTVAEIVQAVRQLRDNRAAAGQTTVAELNQRLKHFLEQKNGLRLRRDRRA